MTASLPALLNQQFWLFGRDVVAASGNRLVEYGGVRAAADRRGKSACYRMPCGCGGELLLWGFGAALTCPRHGVCFLPRFGTVVLAPTRPATLDGREAPDRFIGWQPAEEGGRELFARFAEWFADYEADVRRRHGLAARRADLEGWRELRKPVIEPERIAEEWRTAATGHPTADAA